MPKDIERFWAKVAVAGPDECWEWQACRTPFGYGKLKFGGKYLRAHRVSWELEHSDPGEQCVLHRCDNPCCVNPRHLFLGDRRDNAVDRTEKGRSTGGRLYRNRFAARISVDTAQEIRDRYAAGGVSQSELGRLYGLSQGGICRIVGGKGSRNGAGRLTKLNAEDVTAIRAAYAAGGVRQRELAERYGVSDVTICRIISRKMWAHVP